METYFISGHLDLSKKEFDENYKNKILDEISKNSLFIIGDARGADSLAQKFLVENNVNYENVTIYHMFEKPRNNFGVYKTKGGFQSDEERDIEMTLNSDDDILWVRSAKEQQKKLGNKYDPNFINGTTKNIMRREKMKK